MADDVGFGCTEVALELRIATQVDTVGILEPDRVWNGIEQRLQAVLGQLDVGRSLRDQLLELVAPGSLCQQQIRQVSREKRHNQPDGCFASHGEWVDPTVV